MAMRFRKTPLFLIVFGLVLLGGGVFFGLKEYRIITQGEAVTGTVRHILESHNVQGEELYRPEFAYEYQGRSMIYRPPYRFDRMTYRVGDTETLYVSSEGVTMKGIHPTIIGIALSVVSGLVLVILGAVWFRKGRRPRHRTVYLKRYGKKVHARFIYEEPTHYTLDGEEGYILFFREEKGERVFQSNPVFSNFTIRSVREHLFDVYIDPKNSDKYYVDIEKHFGLPRPHRLTK